MPIYLCKPGWDQSESWRHGVQVYSNPFPIDDEIQNNTNNQNQNKENDDSQGKTPISSRGKATSNTSSNSNSTGMTTNNNNSNNNSKSVGYYASLVRRVRHAEVVLADRVFLKYNRKWLRLRWPGKKGGLAGYIALGLEEETTKDENEEMVKMRTKNENSISSNNDNDDKEVSKVSSSSSDLPSSANNRAVSSTPEALTLMEDPNEIFSEVEDTTPPEEEEDEVLVDIGEKMMMNAANNNNDIHNPRCQSTGIYYPSTPAMELLSGYDDGLVCTVVPSSFSSSNNNFLKDPVFCRICREGIHDVIYEDETNQVVQGHNNENTNTIENQHNIDANITTSPQHYNYNNNNNINNMNDEEDDEDCPHELVPIINTNHPSCENPLMSPCECSGSMAFVHYLCLEQWRCRSNHPKAKNGLHCETCGAPYMLPPPIRTTLQSHNNNNPNNNRMNLHGGANNNGDDWLDAMPPHVLNALRNPNLWWQIGAAIVRRKYLRPMAPILISPIAALYCKARRTLKKRGVSRRRWACSLCGRRARWKCVRCLRSYYCSRQCQNVSWHIVHKHVCYKPSRVIWSAGVYAAIIAILIPGTWRDPYIYLLSIVVLIPFNFTVFGILGGALASLTKQISRGAWDIRGRSLELSVVFGTLVLSFLTFGVVNAYFGSQERTCLGLFNIIYDSNEEEESHYSASYPYYYESSFKAVLLTFTKNLIFEPIKKLLEVDDFTIQKALPNFISQRVCQTHSSYCFERIHSINTNFMFEEEKCASDLSSVILPIYLLAFLVVLKGYLYSFFFTRRRRRAAGERAAPAVGGVVGALGQQGVQQQHQQQQLLHRQRRGFLAGIVMQRPHQD